MNDFHKELEQLVNRYSKENDSNTPDYILAAYISNALWAFNVAVSDRERHYGRKKDEHTFGADPSIGRPL